MRVIGHVEKESAARVFADYLFAQGIGNRLEPQEPDGWAVWVEDEDRLTEAKDLLDSFRANPADPRFQEAAKTAGARRKQLEEDKKGFNERLRDRRHLFKPLTGYGFGPVTFILIAISVVVFFLSRFGSAHEPISGLYITRFWEDGMN